VYYVNGIGGVVVSDSASSFLSRSKSGEPDRVTLKRLSVNEKVLLGAAGNFKTGHAPTEDPDVGRFKNDFKD
jgi:pantoate kinase